MARFLFKLFLPLASGSCISDEELEALKRQQCNVFVIHTSLELGVHLFQTAKKMEMTGDRYLWIATNGITNLLHAFNSTMNFSERHVGVTSYFPENMPEKNQNVCSVFPNAVFDEMAVADVIHTTLGPGSMLKMLLDASEIALPFEHIYDVYHSTRSSRYILATNSEVCTIRASQWDNMYL